MTGAAWQLATWFSPAYPVGAYTYSHGLETAVADGRVHDRASTAAWIADCLEHGAGRTDAILLAAAWRASSAHDAKRLGEITELALALPPALERRVETTAQGAAFAEVAGAVGGLTAAPAPYCIAVGRAAAEADVPLAEVLILFLHAVASNLVSAAIRLVPLGQTDGQRVLAAVYPLCRQLAAAAEPGDTDEIGGSAILSDIAAMRHETQRTRLFRT